MSLDFQPGEPPPGYPDPNGNLDSELIATLVLTAFLTTIFTAARLIANRSIGKFGVDDYLSAITWVLYMGYVAINSIQTEAGIGKHAWNIKASSSRVLSITGWAIEIEYCFMMPAAKTALLYQLQRLFAPAAIGIVFILTQILIWTNVAFYFAVLVALLVQCVPQKRIWDPSITAGHCFDVIPLLIAMGAFNVVSDISILLLPMWAIWHLQIRTKAKLGVTGVFATGLLAVTSSICRLIYNIPPLHSQDVSYLLGKTVLWSMAEVTSIILCTCFPLMPRFVRVIRGDVTSDKKPRKSQSSQYLELQMTRNTGESHKSFQK